MSYGTALNKTKTESKFDKDQNDIQRLMCAVPGCQNRWSVHADGQKPNCSFHQWGKKKEPVKYFNEVDF